MGRSYIATRGPTRFLISKRIDGSSEDELLATTDRHLHVGSWSPNATVLVSGSPNRPDAGVWLLEKSDKWQLRSLFKTPYQIRGPLLSPDGKWLAYSSNENNRFEIYIQPFPGTTSKFQVSTDGGTEAIWSKHGSELFYRSGDKMMTVSLDLRRDNQP